MNILLKVSVFNDLPWCAIRRLRVYCKDLHHTSKWEGHVTLSSEELLARFGGGGIVETWPPPGAPHSGIVGCGGIEGKCIPIPIDGSKGRNDGCTGGAS